MEGLRSESRGLPGASATDTATAAEDDELADRRAAVGELGGQLRALNEAAVRTEVSPAVLRQVADDVARLTDTLDQRQREPSKPSSVDDLRDGVRMYNPVIGTGHPTAPPVHYELHGTRVEASCTLGITHEGPPTSGHGGISALLLDQMLGHATAAVGNIGVTTRMTVRYRKAVPLGVPLRIWAEAVEVDGQRTTTKGAIATAAEPDVTLVEAEGHFLSLSEEQTRRMLPELFGAADSHEDGNGEGS